MKLIISIFFVFLLGITLKAENFVIKVNTSNLKLNQVQSLSNKISKAIPTIKSKSNSTMSANNLSIELDKYYIFKGTKEELEKLKSQIEILEVEPNYIYKIESDCFPEPTDKLYKQQWALKSVNALKAWQYSTGKGVKVAVIDTGIDYNNKQLKSNLWINSKEDINGNGTFEPWDVNEKQNGITGDLNGIDEDGNGFADDVIGYDFVNQYTTNIGDARDIDADPADENGHGTNVSGVIAAKKDDEEIIGLAFNAQIMSIRAFDISGNAESDDIASAIVYAANNGAKVINMSFGEVFESALIRTAIKYASSLGVTLVAASGNNNWSFPHYPSDFDEVISVAGLDQNNTKFGSSNYGNYISIAAPARDILTTDLGNRTKSTSGTSFSSPYVAAAAALILELNPKLNSGQVRCMLETYADDAGSVGWDSIYGAGRLNIGNVLENYANSNISIKGISSDNFYNLNKEDVNITISASNPLLTQHSLYIGIGLNPEKWTLLFSTNENIDNKLYSINKNTLVDNQKIFDTTYTLRFVQELKNLNTLERRVNFTINSNEKNEILFSNMIYAVQEDKYITIFSAVTSFKSNFSIMIKDKASQLEEVYTEYEKKSPFHTIIVNESVDLTKKDVFYIAVTGIDTIKQPLINIQDGPKGNNPIIPKPIIKKDYSLPFVFLNNNVSEKLYSGYSSIATNDFDNLGYGNTKTFIFDKSKMKFMVKDSSLSSYIPVGFGDSNKDGIEEIYATGDYSNLLTQANTINGNPLDNTLYLSDGTTKAGGSKMFDIDKDGTPELFGRNDTAYFSIKFNGSYSQFNVAQMPKGMKGINSIDKASAIGDFDGDGNNELAFMNEQGMLYVFEYNNGVYNLEFVDSNRYSNSSQHLVSGDIDGDGKLDLITLTNTPVPFYSIVNGYDELWHLRVYKSDSKDNYTLYTNNYIYGVRAGNINKVNQFYKNSLAVGKVYSGKNEQVVVSVFPNLYIFNKNINAGYLNPTLIDKNSFSSGILIYDFDKNGTNEIGFTSFEGTKFIEMNNLAFPKPNIYKISTINDKKVKVYFELPNSIGIKSYSVDLQYRLLGDTSWTSQVKPSPDLMDLTTLITDRIYEMRLRNFGINNNDDSVYSDFTDITQIMAHLPYSVQSIKQVNKNIIVKYNGQLPLVNIQNSVAYCELNNKILTVENILTNNDSTAIISFIDNTMLESGTFRIKLSAFDDNFYLSTLPFDSTFNINFSIEKTLYIKSFSTFNLENNFNEIKVNFNKNLDLASVIKENFEISNNGKITSIKLIDSSLYLKLDEDSFMYGKGKYIKIVFKGVKSIDGIKIDESANTIMIGSPSNDLNDVYVYPQPIKLSSCDKVIFGNITPKSTITILDLDGSYINKLQEYDANGGTEWNLLDSKGNQVKPGIYLFKVESSDSKVANSELMKFAILP